MSMLLPKKWDSNNSKGVDNSTPPNPKEDPVEVQLSKHFTLDELVATSRTKYAEQNREYGIKNILKLKEHAEFLEKVRDLLGCSMLITSSVRCPELNTAVGGVATSQHMKCEASDFVPSNMTVPDAFYKIFRSNLSFDQLILEEVGGKQWVHISNKGLLNRREALVYNGKKYVKYTG